MGQSGISRLVYGLRMWGSVAVAGLGLSVFCALMARFGGDLGWLLSSLVVGLAVGAIWDSAVRGSLLAAAVVLVGLGASAAGHAGIRQDVAPVLALPIIVGALVSALACFGAIRLRSGRRMPAWMPAVGALAALSLILVLGSATRPVLSDLATPAHDYRYDASIYRSTFERMEVGVPYYQALVEAAAGDLRLREERDVRGGRFYGWIQSPVQMRLPYLFYAWKFLAGNSLGVFWLAVGTCIVALASLYLGLRRYIGEAAVLAAIAVFPLMHSVLTGADLFFPDFWAGLLVLIGASLWLLRRYALALVVLFLAGMCRDLALLGFGVFGIYACVQAVRQRGIWLRPAGVVLSGCALFLVLLWAHFVQAGPLIARSVNPGTTVVTLLSGSSTSGFAQKFLEPIVYMDFWWSALGLGAVALPVLGLVGWAWALRADHTALIPVVGLLAAWIVFTATIGAHSNYWGLMYTPLMHAGIGALLGSLLVVASASRA